MCYEVKCPNCGKRSWKGCGGHVPAVYKRIPAGQHCECKAWPGVKPSEITATAGGSGDSKVSASCTIL